MASTNLPLGRNVETLKTYTAMIVDDSSTVRVAVKKVLTSEDFDVIFESENGKNALSKLKVTGIIPDFIFLDYEMPRMNGLEFLEELKAMKCPSKVVVVSTISEKQVLEKFLRLGIDSYVVKPIERRILIEHIARIIGRDDYL